MLQKDWNTPIKQRCSFEISDNLDKVNNDSDGTVEGGRNLSGEDEMILEEEDNQADKVTMFQDIEDKLRKVKSKKGKKKRKSVYKIVAGREITSDTVYDALNKYEAAKKKPEKSVSSENTKSKSSLKLKLVKNKQTKTPQQKLQKSAVEPQPGPSHINLALSSCSSSDKNKKWNTMQTLDSSYLLLRGQGYTTG